MNGRKSFPSPLFLERECSERADLFTNHSIFEAITPELPRVLGDSVCTCVCVRVWCGGGEGEGEGEREATALSGSIKMP